MWSALRRGTGIACIRLAFQPIKHRKLDEDKISNPIIRDSDSSVDRVLKIFDRDENGTISGEASFITIFGFTGGLVGALYGGLVQSKYAIMNFRESNEAVLYYSNKAASRELLDATTIGFGKGVAKWGVRYAIFCTSLAALSTIFARIRGEFGILEYSYAGLITGAIYKFGLGPKGMISGGFFGGFLGTVGGVLFYILTKLTGATMEDTYEILKIYYKTKDLNFHAAQRHDEEPDIIIEQYYPGGRDSMEHSLDKLEDIQSVSELKYNKNYLPKSFISKSNTNANVNVNVNNKSEIK